MRHFATMIMILAMGATGAWANLVSNADFSSAFTEIDTINSPAAGEWYAHTQWNYNAVNQVAEKTQGNFANLVQIIPTAGLTGEQLLSFDYKGIQVSASYRIWVDIRGLTALPASLNLGSTLGGYPGTRLWTANDPDAVNIFWGNGLADVADNLTNTTFANAVVPFDLGAGYNYVLVGFRGQQSGATYLPTVDNVVVTPEPATLAVLGLGGLALLRRRRA